MKIKSTILPISLLGIFAALSASGPAFGSSNFQIAPPPIAYPYFESGRTDSKVEPAYIDVKATDFSLKGGGVNFDSRHAFSDSIAADVQGGIFALNGEMPGVPPITPIPAYSGGTFLGYWMPQATGKAKVTVTSVQMSINLEFQPFHNDSGGLIVFGGPSLGVMNMVMNTPYSLTFGATTNSGYTDTLTISSVTTGLQVGLQGDITLARNLKISPFLMTSSYSGTSTLKDDPNVSTASGYSTTADIPSYSSSSMGMDIVIGNLSIGTLLQQMKSQKNSSDNVKVTMLRMGYRF